MAQEDPRALYETAVRKLLDGALAEAEAGLRALHAAYPAEPHIRHSLSLALLRQGRYAEAWPLFEARHEIPEFGPGKPPLPIPAWRGESLAGKRLLIWPEQGFGDQIQYARFAPRLARQGAEVTLVVAAPLARLFSTLEGVRVIETGHRLELSADVWAGSSSIPGLCGAAIGDLPAPPYLSATPRRRGGVGVMVRGNPNFRYEAERKLPEALAERLLTLPGAVDLTPEATGAEDFADTAAIIAGLDLVISTDTSVAHLTGALGKPLRVLVSPRAGDWRWGEEGPAAPWYPSARVYRQARDGDWSEAVAAATADLPGNGKPGPETASGPGDRSGGAE